MLNYAKRDLLISKVVALKELSDDVLVMLKELDVEDASETTQEEVTETVEELAEELPEEVETVEEEEPEEPEEPEELEPEITSEQIWSDYEKADLIEIMKEELNIQLPKNSRKAKIIELLDSLIAEKGEDYVISIFYATDEEAEETEVEELQDEEIVYLDDEGVEHGDREAFFVDGELYCCGVQCDEEEDGVMVCPKCGAKYTFEE